MATNSTPNYDLPLVIDTDKPTWRGDFNSAMSKIDAALEENSHATDDYDARITRAQNTADAAQADATANKNLFIAMGVNGSSDAAAIRTDIDKAKSDSATAVSVASNAQREADEASTKADANAEAITALSGQIDAKLNKPAMSGTNGQTLYTNGAGQTYWGDAGGYVLPKAGPSTLGGVKIGSGIDVAGDGTISVDSGSQYTLPTASASTKGGIKVGNGLVMSGDTANVNLNQADGKLNFSDLEGQLDFSDLGGRATNAQLPAMETISVSQTGTRIDALNVAHFGPVVMVDFNVSSPVSVNQGENAIATLPSGYRPKSQKASLIAVTEAGQFTGFVSASGTIGIYSSASGSQQCNGRTSLVFIAGA